MRKTPNKVNKFEVGKLRMLIYRVILRLFNYALILQNFVESVNKIS